MILPKNGEHAEIEIRLTPLVRVHGSIEGPGAGERPQDVYVLARPPYNPARPLDHTWLAYCRSVEARFEMWLPPGRYVLDAHALREGRDGGVEDARVVPDPKIVLTAKTPRVDMGVLRLSPFKPTLSARIASAKAAGTWDDYTKHYGKPSPRWHVTDTLGVKKDIQISDFKGKWVLVYFWSRNCIPCLRSGDS